MPQFTMQLAGCSVQARCLYDSTRQFCRDYLTTGTAAPDALCAASDAAFLTACALNGTPPARGDDLQLSCCHAFAS